MTVQTQIKKLKICSSIKEINVVVTFLLKFLKSGDWLEISLANTENKSG